MASVGRGAKWERELREEEGGRGSPQARNKSPVESAGAPDLQVLYLQAEPRRAEVLREEWCPGAARRGLKGWAERVMDTSLCGHVSINQRGSPPPWASWDHGITWPWEGRPRTRAQRLLQPIQRDTRESGLERENKGVFGTLRISENQR